MRPRRIISGVIVLLIVAALGWGWARRDSLQAWYFVRQLAQADEADRERLADRVAAMGDAAVPTLLERLNDADAKGCGNLRLALDRLASTRLGGLLRQVGEQWPRLNAPARCLVLESTTIQLQQAAANREQINGLLPAAALLLDATAKDDETVRSAALSFCDCLSTIPDAATVREPSRELVRCCLKAESVDVRLRAIQTAQRPGMDMLAQVAGLLSDPAVEVRRAALVAVAPPDRAVPDDLLLPRLHDESNEIRQLCEDALVERGLKPIHLKLGRLVTHPHFLSRIRVLEELRELETKELEQNIKSPVDPGPWMCRLSRDPMPSVRAAAAWALAQQDRDDCGRRLTEMAREDPSETVRGLVKYYVRQAER